MMALSSFNLSAGWLPVGPAATPFIIHPTAYMYAKFFH